MSLPVVEQMSDPDDENGDGIEDSYERFARFNGR